VSDGGGDPIFASALIGFPVQFLIYQQLAADNAAAVREFFARWSPPVVSSRPRQAAVRFGRQQQFSASVSCPAGAASCGAFRSPGGGTIDANGLYSAPRLPTARAHLPRRGPQRADGSVRGVATVKPASALTRTDRVRYIRRVSLSAVSGARAPASGALRRCAASSGCARPACPQLAVLASAAVGAGSSSRRPRARALRLARERIRARPPSAARCTASCARSAGSRVRSQARPVRRDPARRPARRVHEALASLRDRVPPLPFARIRAAVEASSGAARARVRGVRRRPLGAASIAQAHRARLPAAIPSS
jgi:hypothetical protein